MGIRFYCPNGHKLNVKSFQAGRRGICPHCGAKVQIPLQSTRPASKGQEGDAQQIETEAPAPASPSAQAAPMGRPVPSTPSPTSQPGAAGTPQTPQATPNAYPSFGQATFSTPTYGGNTGSPNNVQPAPQYPAGQTGAQQPSALTPGQPYNQASTTSPGGGGGFPTFGHASGPQGPTQSGPGAAEPAEYGMAPAGAGYDATGQAGWGAGSGGPAPAAQAASRPDPLAEDPGAVWYVRLSNGGQYGPAGADVMRSWLGEGRIAPDALVWREGWRDWQEASAVFAELGADQDDVPLADLGAGPPERPGRSRGSRVRSRRRNDNLRAALIVILLLAVIILFGVFIWVLNQEPPVPEGGQNAPGNERPAVEMPAEPAEPPADDML